MEIFSSFIEPLMSCIGPPVIRQFGYLKAKENVEELTRHAGDLEAMKKDIQDKLAAEDRLGKKPTELVQRWIKSVEDLSLEVTAVQRDYEQSGRCGCRLPSYYKIGRRASKLLMKLNAQEERSRLTGECLAIDKPPPSVVQQLSSALVGDMIHSNKEKICGYLKEETDGVIGILGMGGVGKTTLLEAINDNFLSNNGNSVTNNNLFDHVIFIVVSKEYKLENLQKMMVEKLGLRWREGLVSHAQIISEYLEKKNFLLLLDDIWEAVQLKDLGILPDPCQAGSSSISERRFRRKVVFTTRKMDVCTGMKCHGRRNIIEVDCLKKEEAWNLFNQNVGEDIINLPEIRSRAKKVVKKCGGLPLALVVIGRAMATKKMPGEWDYALTQLKKLQPKNISGMENEDKYFLRLKFSYDSLQNDKMRECFLCCSLWPEDCEIEREELILCWMGLGLIDGFEDINEAYDEGDSLIGSLIVASLLQDDGDFIKVHDVIRDLALWIACDSGTNRKKWLVKARAGLKEVPREVVANWEAAERISLMKNEIKGLPSHLPTCNNLSTLLLQNNYFFTLIPEGFFTCMPNITYLDLFNTRIKEIPKEICCLVQLRYLNLSSTSISSLPEELGQLINLKYLLVRYTNIGGEVIRGIIGRLEKLVYLDLYPGGSVETDELVRSLLKGVGMKITSEHALQQLSRVPILYLNIKDYMEGDSSTTSICLQHHLLSLRELMFTKCHSIRELVMDVDVHFPRLESLQLRELENLTEIVWRRSVVPPSECFQRLQNLTIQRCHGLKDITWVLHLPCLEVLSLDECNGMEQLVVFGGGGEEERELEVTKPTFPRLRELFLADLPKLAMICDNHATAAAVNFPSLKVLHVSVCNGLKDITWVLHLPCLEELSLSSCDGMEQLVVIGGGGEEERELEVTKPTFPRLTMLSLYGLPKLVMICDNHAAAAVVNFPSLERLYVSNCNGLKDITWVLHLPCLEELVLTFCDGMEQLVVIGGGGEEERELEVTKPTFPRLRELELFALPKLAMICDNSAAAINFPSLKTLRVSECKELKRLPFHPQLLNKNNNCSRLREIYGEREWWEGIEWEEQSAQSSLLQPFFHQSGDRYLLPTP